MTYKPRARRGYTFDPCPACKQPPRPERAKDDICDDCRRLIDAGKALADRQKADERKAYWLPWNMPGYYDADVNTFNNTPPGLERFANRSVRNAADWIRVIMPALALAVGEEVTGSEGTNGLGFRGTAKPARADAGRVFVNVDREPRNREVRELVLLTDDQRELLRDLDRAIRIALAETAANALERGSNLLGSLATGRITADDLDEETARDVAERRRTAAKFAEVDA